MHESIRIVGYLMSANVQAVSLIVLAYYSAEYLDQHYPLAFSWQRLLIPVAVVFAAYSYYLILRFIIRLENKKKQKKDHDI